MGRNNKPGQDRKMLPGEKNRRRYVCSIANAGPTRAAHTGQQPRGTSSMVSIEPLCVSRLAMCVRAQEGSHCPQAPREGPGQRRCVRFSVSPNAKRRWATMQVVPCLIWLVALPSRSCSGLEERLRSGCQRLRVEWVPAQVRVRAAGPAHGRAQPSP